MKQYDEMSRDELLKEIESLQREKRTLLLTQNVALRESEDRYRRLIETANEGVWILDGKGVTTFVNAKMGVMLGYHPEEMVGRHLFDFTDDEAREVAQEMLVRRKQGLREQFDFRFRTKEGYDVWTLLCTNPIYDHEQRYVGALAMVTDITDRRRTDDALRESEARNRAMIEAFDGLAYICSPDYRIEYMNERFKKRMGKDATGELCHQALHNLDSVCPWCVNDRVFAGQTVQWEVKSPKDERWYQVSNTPIYNSDGTVSKYAMIADITIWKEAEEYQVKQKAMLRQAAKLSHFASWEWDPRDDIFIASGELSSISGITTSPTTLEAWVSLAHPEDRPAVGRLFREGLSANTVDITYRVLHQTGGAQITLRLLGEVIRDSHQNAICMCGVAQQL